MGHGGFGGYRPRGLGLLLWVMVIFSNLLQQWMHNCMNMSLNCTLKWVNGIVSELYLNKAVKN